MKSAWVISGGGARIVQALVLIEKHLKQGGKMPEMIVGTSAGGLLAILIAHLGVEGAKKQIFEIADRHDIFGNQFLGGIRKLGIWDHKPLQELLSTIVYKKKAMPYYVCVYNIKTHQKQFLSHAHGWYNLAATACIPLLVNPVGDCVDGGLVENKPLQFPIDRGFDDIELFSCSAPETPSVKSPRTKLEMAIRCFGAMSYELARDDTKVCWVKNRVEGFKNINVHFHALERNHLGVLDFDKLKEGYKGAKNETK